MAITQEESPKQKVNTADPAYVCGKICVKSESSRIQNAALESLKAEVSIFLTSWSRIR